MSKAKGMKPSGGDLMRNPHLWRDQGTFRSLFGVEGDAAIDQPQSPLSEPAYGHRIDLMLLYDSIDCEFLSIEQQRSAEKILNKLAKLLFGKKFEEIRDEINDKRQKELLKGLRHAEEKERKDLAKRRKAGKKGPVRVALP
jgi:hypothetical protein